MCVNWCVVLCYIVLLYTKARRKTISLKSFTTTESNWETMNREGSTSFGQSHEVRLDTWSECKQYAAQLYRPDSSQVPSSTEMMFQPHWNKSVERLCNVLNDKYARVDEQCVCFPSYQVAKRCREWIRKQVAETNVKVRILQLSTAKPVNSDEMSWKRECKIAVVFVRKIWYPVLFNYWQITGEVISKSVAEYVLHELFIIEKSHRTVGVTGSSANQNSSIGSNNEEKEEEIDFIESRFGRTMDFTLEDKAKRLIKKRIITKVVDDDHNDGNSRNEDDEMSNSINGVNNSIMDLMSLRAFEDSDDDDMVNENPIRSLIPPEPINANIGNIEHVDMTDNVDGMGITNDGAALNTDNNTNTNNGNNSYIHNDNLNADKDVYLFPSELNPVYMSHRLLLSLDLQRINRSRNGSNFNILNGVSADRIPFKKTVVLGYMDPTTISLLRSFNEIHYINDTSANAMMRLKRILHSGEQILAVYVDIPNSISLTTINLHDLKSLSELFGFHIVINDSNNNMINVDVMSYCDMICGSLTKIFAPDNSLSENVISCGALILNPMSRIYTFMINFMLHEYEDNVWCEDAIHLERNSRDFIQQNSHINANALKLVNEVLIPQLNKGVLEEVSYPNVVDTEVYEMIKCKKYGGYGSVINIRFSDEAAVEEFYNRVQISKGSALSSTRTTIYPHILLQPATDSHKYTHTLRISVGLENYETLQETFAIGFE